MFHPSLLDAIDYLYSYVECLLEIITEYNQENSDVLRTQRVEEMAQSLTELYETSCLLKKECIHRYPEFMEFLASRPYFKVKYHRKRSENYHYIDPTISREFTHGITHISCD